VLKRKVLSDKVGMFHRLAMLAPDDHARRMVSGELRGLISAVQGMGSGAEEPEILKKKVRQESEECPTLAKPNPQG
jgi:hypothetical protein